MQLLSKQIKKTHSIWGVLVGGARLWGLFAAGVCVLKIRLELSDLKKNLYL